MLDLTEMTDILKRQSSSASGIVRFRNRRV